MVGCTAVVFIVSLQPQQQRKSKFFYQVSSHWREPNDSTEVTNSSGAIPSLDHNNVASEVDGTVWTSVKVNRNSAPGVRNCQPRTNLMFLKIHKCASSTAQRIFLRYGKKHKLTQVLPLTGNYLGAPPPFKSAMIPHSLRTPDNTYNMMVIHTRLHTPELEKVMKPDAKWVTIVREPVAQFLSLWAYFDLMKFYNKTLEEFAKLPYEKVVRWRNARVYGIHQMFYDLGYGSAEEYGEKEMTAILQRLNQTFHLVMLAERFDESLVLLKDLMCWRTEDVAYLSINSLVRPIDSATTLTNTTRAGILRLSKPDVQIYDFFSRMFQERVEGFGVERMAQEVQLLRQANQHLTQICTVDRDDPRLYKEHMNWIDKVKPLPVRGDIPECIDMAKTELSILDDVRSMQRVWSKKGWPHLVRDRG
ncbi:hypothetical protein Pmani_026597 [Petrolisthes manimaculis]|uniref:Galactosylceramide sulfotransferase n=1 Tax=Petrolisthes manimaculis TaxID=1843537 RepID=A0AAE1TZZ5_9EUCA|nr:hypothetical protein Pmani_026597 [Petrolisthes manimaculis]